MVGPMLAPCPQLRSAELAQHLEALEESAAPLHPPSGRQLALGLYRRLGLSQAACRLLLQEGRVLEAARLVAQRGLWGVLHPEHLLQEAATTGDLLLFAGVWRVCSAAAAAPASQHQGQQQQQQQRLLGFPVTFADAVRPYARHFDPAALASVGQADGRVIPS